MSLLDLTLMEKQVVGSLFGSGNPRADIPKLLGLYRRGPARPRRSGHQRRTRSTASTRATRTCGHGKNIRGVIVYE